MKALTVITKLMKQMLPLSSNFIFTFKTHLHHYDTAAGLGVPLSDTFTSPF